MLKRKPEDNIKELTKIQKVKYMSAVTCILTVQEKNREQNSGSFPHWQACTKQHVSCLLTLRTVSELTLPVKEVIAHPGGIGRYNKRFHCLSHYSFT